MLGINGRLIQEMGEVKRMRSTLLRFLFIGTTVLVFLGCSQSVKKRHQDDAKDAALAEKDDAVAPVVETETPAYITAEGFLARGRIIDVGTPAAIGSGFCVGTNDEPRPGDGIATCRDLGAPTGPGSFEDSFDGLVAGRVYRVRAFAVHSSLGTYYGDSVPVRILGGTGTLSAPIGVQASDGTSTTEIAVTWEPVFGASSYRVYRDGLRIAEVYPTSYADSDAIAGGAPEAPSNLTASEGSLTDGVELTWDAVSSPIGSHHMYAVTTVNAAGESAPSNADDGYRAAYPITLYEVSIDDGDFESVGLVTTWTDQSAPAGRIIAGEASASDGTFADHVALVIEYCDTSEGAARRYVVRARNQAGAGAESSAANGYRGVGALSYQWQRSYGDSDSDYTDLLNADSDHYDDATFPISAPGRLYRCTVSAEGASPVISNADRGWLLHDPPSDIARDDFWVTNGEVSTLAIGDGVLYAGGSFTYVGPNTGSFVGIDPVSGAADLIDLRVNYRVTAIATDGNGGFYIGGSFTEIDGVPRPGIAHILADGTLDPIFIPAIGGTIRTLVTNQSAVYVSYDSIPGDSDQWFIAAIDADTGALNWNVYVDNGGAVALLLGDNKLYAGGGFGNLGAQEQRYFAALDATTGSVTDWNPAPDNFVNALALSGSTLYVGGNFTSIGGENRNRLAALNLPSGDVLDWNPSADERVNVLAVNDNIVYVGGSFTSIGGEPRENIAALNAATGDATDWNPDVDGDVYAFAVNASAVYVGGTFRQIDGINRNYLAELDSTTGVVNDWNPNAGNTVYAITVSDDVVYAGGAFTSIGGIDRNGVAAFDTATGVATAWDVKAEGSSVYGYERGEINSITVDGDTVYVGGDFTSIGGEDRTGIAALAASTGFATDWNPGLSGWVETAAQNGDVIYVGGFFNTVGDQDRICVAAIDKITGNATGWNADLYESEPMTTYGSWIRLLALGGDTLYMAGIFNRVGEVLLNNVAALDAATGALKDRWAPWTSIDWLASIDALAVSNGIVYIGGHYSGSFAAVDAITGNTANTDWNPEANGAVKAITISDGTVYAGGNFSSIGGENRNNLAALDSTTGLANDWNPDIWNPNSVYSNIVDTVIVSGSTIYVGGSFIDAGGRAHANLAVFEP